MVGEQAELAARLSCRDEQPRVLRLLAMNREELRRRLEVRAVRQAFGCGQSCWGGRPQKPFGRLAWIRPRRCSPTRRLRSARRHRSRALRQRYSPGVRSSRRTLAAASCRAAVHTGRSCPHSHGRTGAGSHVLALRGRLGYVACWGVCGGGRVAGVGSGHIIRERWSTPGLVGVSDQIRALLPDAGFPVRSCVGGRPLTPKNRLSVHHDQKGRFSCQQKRSAKCRDG